MPRLVDEPADAHATITRLYMIDYYMVDYSTTVGASSGRHVLASRFYLTTHHPDNTHERNSPAAATHI
jgi:hypothetical protein